MHKYRAKSCVIDGIRFPSLREGKRYRHLKLLEKAGEIEDLTLQPGWDIKINGIQICKVKLDFQYWDVKRRVWVFEDSKGCDTPMSRIKRKMVQAAHKITVSLV